MNRPALVLGAAAGVALVYQHVQHERRLDAEHRKLISDHPKTPLLNERGLHEIGGQRLAEAHRHGQLVLVIYLDLDRFKAINDRYGHAAADQLLHQVALAFAPLVSRCGGVSARRGEGVASRLHGDEFAAILPVPHGAGEQWATVRMVAISNAIFDTVARPDGWPVHASVGAVLAPPTYRLSALLEHADRAMYEAKRSGSPELRALGQEERAA